IVSLLLVARDDTDRLLDELFCVLDVESEEHLDILARLGQDFAVDVHLYDARGRRVQYLQYRKPLEENVDYILEKARQLLSDVDPAERDFSKASKMFASHGYERVGAQRHNFTKDSFAAIKSAGSARLAVSMVAYWSEAQNFHYLIENRSFPLPFFLEIQRRVIQGGIRYGIHLSNELSELAIEWGMAENRVELLAGLVERFAELTSRRSCELDSMAQSENWDQLLTACVDLGVRVDESVTEIAHAARRRARAGITTPGASWADVLETSEYQRVSSYANASNDTLRGLLKRGGVAPDVSRELLGRGGETNILHVIEAAPVLDEDAILRTARFLAAGAEQFEPALLIGLGRRHRRTIHMCALALATARRVEALPTLFELLHSDRAADVPVREIIARYGDSAMQPLFDAIEKFGPTDELIEVMALISIDSGASLIKALKERPSANLLEAAQKMVPVRKLFSSRPIRSVTDLGEPDPEALKKLAEEEEE
ncbi:MAG: hypothetical protein KC561_09775, partial [Myxococcales bacterium]|nr:hypothetical protein [Myxococcales bacterium]